MKKSLLILLFALGMGYWGWGQIIAWQFGSPASAGNEVTYNATTNDANLNTSVLSRGAGVNPSALARGFSSANYTASGTKADAITNNKYMQFIISAKSGYQVSLSTLDARLRRSSSGPNAYIWRYSTDGTNFTDIGTDISFTSTVDGVDQTQINLSGITALQNVSSGTVITMRIYSWGATATTGTFAVGRYASGITTNSLVIGGSVSAIGGVATKLSITSINGGNSPSTNTPFSVVVQSQDASNTPTNVSANTNFSLSVATGTGSLGGTLTGTITVGTNSATVTGVTYTTAEAGVSITATRTSGDVLSPGTSSLFTVLAAADHLVFVNAPSYGLIATNLNTFTVEARRPDNTVDVNYISNIAVSKASGSGNLTGTTVKTPVNGISSYNDLQFDVADNYTLNATSGTLTGATSGNIEIVSAILAYRSIVSGNWNNINTWEGYTGTQWIPSFDWPVSPTKDVTVRTGHSVVVPTSYNLGTAKNLTIESGATLYANASSGSCFVYVYGDIQNDGTIGGTNDVIGFDIEGTSCQLNGSGSFIAARIAKFTTANTTTNFTINQNVKLTYTSASSAALRNGQSASTTFNIVLGAGKQLTVPNAKIDLTGCTLTLKSDATGTASLIDNGTISGQTGTNVIVERYLTKDEWHYVSAPVDDPLAGVFLGMYMMEWDEPSGDWTFISDVNYPMTTDMEGFAVWTYNNATATFTGNLNTGAKSIDLTNTPGAPIDNDGYNFVGNPYPSSLDWDLDASWTRTNLDDALYIWIQQTVSGGNYGSYVNGVSQNNVDNVISPNQGFFVHVTTGNATGTLGVNNGARIHASEDIWKSGEVNDDVLKLRVDCNNYYDETVVRINNSASISFDQKDAYKFRGSAVAPQLYSISKDNEELSINTFPVQDDYMVIPVGLEVGADDVYTISVSDFAGFEFSSGIYLEDLKEGTFTKLKAGSTYSFNANPLDEPMRFLLHMNSTLAVPENNVGLSGVQVYSFNSDVYVTSENGLSGKVMIYDLLGREIVNGKLSGETMRKFDLSGHQGYMIVNVAGETGTLNQKVYIR